ncbi:hypothetical protein M9H77_01876 [Catharanthus roseus]|uniref:Uncharacterized protein n=1 Tax=Catharanthus roseus TaxID=4058 RepID=A0ACC0C6X6_CATRO|nr:hypothetical protein M9H77_01876 [Catharanthus roseus]
MQELSSDDLISSEWSGAQQGTETRTVCGVSFYVVMQVVDLAHPSHRWTYREGTLVDESSRTTSSSSSSYSLREIVPKREPFLVIDLSDDELVEGPEMAPVAPGIGLGTSIEEDPSEPTSDSEMMPELEGVVPADA